MPTFRAALPTEDEKISRMYYHAFREVWDHNWFQGLSVLLDPLPSVPTEPQPSQASRILFYSALLSTARMAGGEILVATQHENGNEVLLSAMAWLPPYKRVTASNPWALYRSGYLRLMYLWGWKGINRVLLKYDLKMNQLFDETLKKRSIQPISCARVQIIATNPNYAGHGYGSALLQYQLDNMDRDSPTTPIILDTATQYGRKIYGRLGFVELGEIPVGVGECDVFGLKPKSPIAEIDAERCSWKMWAMVRSVKTER